jgi:hypothetical protein
MSRNYAEMQTIPQVHAEKTDCTAGAVMVGSSYLKSIIHRTWAGRRPR